MFKLQRKLCEKDLTKTLFITYFLFLRKWYEIHRNFESKTGIWQIHNTGRINLMFKTKYPYPPPPPKKLSK